MKQINEPATLLLRTGKTIPYPRGSQRLINPNKVALYGLEAVDVYLEETDSDPLAKLSNLARLRYLDLRQRLVPLFTGSWLAVGNNGRFIVAETEEIVRKQAEIMFPYSKEEYHANCLGLEVLTEVVMDGSQTTHDCLDQEFSIKDGLMSGLSGHDSNEFVIRAEHSFDQINFREYIMKHDTGATMMGVPKSILSNPPLNVILNRANNEYYIGPGGQRTLARVYKDNFIRIGGVVIKTDVIESRVWLVGFPVLSRFKNVLDVNGEEKTLIATHSGSFHADEALAVFLLNQIYKNPTLIRTRVPEEIEKADIVVDVGGVYLPKSNRFDHHQRDFNVTFSENHTVTKLSSAGLVYKHFGLDVLKVMVKDVDADVLELVYQKVYTDFIEGMDAIDNGVSQYPPTTKPLYKESTNLSRRVSRLNPNWNEPTTDLDSRFQKAVALVGAEFTDVVKAIAYSWIPAREFVVKAFNERFKYHQDGLVMVLDQFCPWKEHLFLLEAEGKVEERLRPVYVLYSDYGGSWRIQAVPVAEESFSSRLGLPEEWRGLRDEELSNLIGIKDCIFVHASGFIGGNKTREGALEMAQKAILFYKK